MLTLKTGWSTITTTNTILILVMRNNLSCTARIKWMLWIWTYGWRKLMNTGNCIWKAKCNYLSYSNTIIKLWSNSSTLMNRNWKAWRSLQWLLLHLYLALIVHSYLKLSATSKTLLTSNLYSLILISLTLTSIKNCPYW